MISIIINGVEILTAENLPILFDIRPMFIKEVIEDKAVEVDKLEIFCIRFPGVRNVEDIDLLNQKVYGILNRYGRYCGKIT